MHTPHILLILALITPLTAHADPTVPEAADTLRSAAVAPDVSAKDTLTAARPDTLDLRLLATDLKDYHGMDKIDRMTGSRLYRMAYVGVPLVAVGLIYKKEDTHFRGLRNEYMPHFRRHLDDYTQYVPLALTWGLKAGGVGSRSSWGRMLTSQVFSAALMATAVNVLKHSTSVTRPDGSNNHSFPSGHTATAFMTATMLVREYGHKSPWVGIGAYTVAAGTGLMRMANNKHWMSDVMVGAGIGILSTELGYYLADLIFKGKGLNDTGARAEVFGRYDRPSFAGLYLGFNVPLSHYDIDERTTFRTSSGSVAGLEGAYFFNPYICAGGRMTVANTAIITDDVSTGTTAAEDNTFDILSLQPGVYASYPLSRRWLFGGKLLVGSVYYPRLKLHAQTVPKRWGVAYGTGLSLTFRATEHYGMRFFADYNLLPSHSTASHEHINALTLGSSFVIAL